MNKQGSMQRGKPETEKERLPWPAIGGGLVAAVALALLVLAWKLGGPRRADWVEQPVAAPASASAPASATTGVNSGSKP